MIDVAPKNLFSRFLLIIIIPIFLLLAISVYIFYERHWENVLSRMQDALVNDVKLLTELKKVHNEIFQNSAQVLGFDTETLFLHNNSDINIKGLDIPDRELQVLNSKMMVQLGKYVKSYYIKNAPRIKSFVFEGNEVTVYTYSNKKIHSPTTLVFILWMLVTGLLLIIISITFMKNQVRAIANLAIAAERLGKGQEIGDFRPSGAREVRVAGKGVPQDERAD